MELLYKAVNPWWQGKDFETGIKRDQYLGNLWERLLGDEIEVFNGGRGVGKTTILKQIIKHLLNTGRPAASILYLPMHYPALTEYFLPWHLNEVRSRIFPNRDRLRFLFIDELQSLSVSDSDIKAIQRTGQFKIIAAATTQPPSPRRGRRTVSRRETTVYPLNLKEFITFRGHDAAACAPEQFLELTEDYLQSGGYPAHVLNPAGEALEELTATVAARETGSGGVCELRKAHLLPDLLQDLARRVGFPTTFRQLAGKLRLSADSVKDYLGYLEEAWLVKILERWSADGQERMLAPKKIYLGDNGLRTILSGDMASAARAENAVFLELRRQGVACGYDGQGEGEVDFVIGSRSRPVPIDVRYDDIPNGADWPYQGVRAFISRHPRTRKAVVITKDVEDSLKIEQAAVEVIPLWKALLTESLPISS
jgi:predicted AAA+ superfamily ATPase